MKSIKEIKILYPSKRVIFEIIFCIAIPIFFASCSKNLLKRSDYRSSVSSLKAGDPAAALRFFPSGESNTFIPIMEKTYLNLLQGKPEIDELQKYSTRIENRLKYKVSRELKYLAYVETPEGYFASEHEIIWMHMLLSWGYSLRNDFDSAAIEAKKAAVILEGKSREGRFDDPMIRTLLVSKTEMESRTLPSRYGQRVTYSTTKGTVKATAGITGGILVGILSIAVGGLVVYAGVYANSGEAVLGGFGIMI